MWTCLNHTKYNEEKKKKFCSKYSFILQKKAHKSMVFSLLDA